MTAFTTLPDISLPPLADLWQLLMDGRLLAGRGTPYGITGYVGLGLPDQRTADVALPYEHGIIALGDYHQPRAVVFGLCVSGPTEAGCAPVAPAPSRAGAAWDGLRYLAGVWQARTADVLLELRMTTGQTYVMVGRPRRFEANTDQLRNGTVLVAAEFLATDPRLYSVELRQTVIQLGAAASLTSTWCLATVADPVGAQTSGFCLGVAPWGDVDCAVSLPANSNGLVTLVNRGNTDTLPTVSFFGPATNPELHNLTTDRVMGLAATIAAGDVVHVDMRTRTVTTGDSGTPRYDLLATGSDFWSLVPGENLVLLTQSTPDAATATVIWRDAWL